MPMTTTTTMTAQLVSGASTAVVVGTGITKSLSTPTSMLNSTLSQLATGDYTVYVSDIVSMAGICIGAAGIALTVYKLSRGNI